MYLLDTNICIYFLKNSCPLVTKKILSLNPSKLLISSITVFELEYGAEKSRWSEHTKEKLSTFLAPFVILPFGEKDACAAAAIRANLERKGVPIGSYDLQIAAQALSRDLTLVTHNTKEFGRVSGLKVEDWVSEK